MRTSIDKGHSSKFLSNLTLNCQMDYICNFSPFFGNLSGKESLPLASVQKLYLLVEMIDINSYHKQTKKKYKLSKWVKIKTGAEQQ